MASDIEKLEEKGVTLSSLLRHFLKNKNLDESMEACMIDPNNPSPDHKRYVKNRLVPQYKPEVSKMLEDYIDFISALEDLVKVLERRWRLDKNWIMAIICLVSQDVVTYKTSQKLGIAVRDKEGKFKSTVTLLKEIEEKLKTETDDFAKHRLSAAIGAAKEYHEEFRNGVIHRGELDIKATPRILNVTKDLLQELYSCPIGMSNVVDVRGYEKTNILA